MEAKKRDYTIEYFLCYNTVPEDTVVALDQYLNQITLWEHSPHSAPYLDGNSWYVRFNHPRDTQYTRTWESIANAVTDFITGYKIGQYLTKKRALSIALASCKRSKGVWDPAPLLAELSDELLVSWKQLCSAIERFTGRKRFSLVTQPSSQDPKADLYGFYHGHTKSESAHASMYISMVLRAVERFNAAKLNKSEYVDDAFDELERDLKAVKDSLAEGIYYVDMMRRSKESYPEDFELRVQAPGESGIKRV
jgi:hypothetical protein